MKDMLQIIKDLYKKESDQIDLNAIEISILDIVCEHTGYEVKDLQSKSRQSELVLARSITAVLLVQSGASLTRAGKILNRGHDTVLYHKNKHSNHIKYWQPYKDLFKKCKDEYFTRFTSDKINYVKEKIDIYKKRINVLEDFINSETNY